MFRASVSMHLQDRVEALTTYIAIWTPMDDEKGARINKRSLKVLYTDERASYGYYNGKSSVEGTIRHCLEYPRLYKEGTSRLSELAMLLIYANKLFYAQKDSEHVDLNLMIDNVTMATYGYRIEPRSARILAKAALEAADRGAIIELLTGVLTKYESALVAEQSPAAEPAPAAEPTSTAKPTPT